MSKEFEEIDDRMQRRMERQRMFFVSTPPLAGESRRVEPHESAFEKLAALFPDLPTIRNIVVIDGECMHDSCGYGVP